MEQNQVIDLIIKVVGIGVSVTTLVFAYLQYRTKIQLEIFDKYTNRYNQIVTSEMVDCWRNVINGKGTDAENASMKLTMIKYLNLVWEEYYLYDSGLIPKKLWKIWEPEIKQIFELDFTKQVIKSSFTPEFLEALKRL